MTTNQSSSESARPDATADPIVSFDDVTKRFGRVVAIRDVSLNVYENEILGVIGDNGAGKSTLMKTLAGVHRATSGTIRYKGSPVDFSDPSEARRKGIETVYQDLALMDDLDIATNIFMGRFPARATIGPVRVIDWDQTYERAGELISRLGQDIDLKTEVEFLSGGQRQLVAVARALLFDPEVIIFDEPTSALSVAGAELVHETIRNLQKDGHTQIVISHNIENIIDLVDRIAVMYQGQIAAVLDPDDADRDTLAELMTTGEIPS